MDTVGLTGGDFDADTQDAVTQYYFTVPSQYLDIALHLERSRATGLLMSQPQWTQERGAITQEVTQDNSNAINRLFKKMWTGCSPERRTRRTASARSRLRAQVNSKNLLNFYSTWYHPNNAIYIIVGDVEARRRSPRSRRCSAIFRPQNFRRARP